MTTRAETRRSNSALAVFRFTVEPAAPAFIARVFEDVELVIGEAPKELCVHLAQWRECAVVSVARHVRRNVLLTTSS